MPPVVPINIGTDAAPEIIDLQRVSTVTIFPDPEPSRAWVQLFLPSGLRAIRHDQTLRVIADIEEAARTHADALKKTSIRKREL